MFDYCLYCNFGAELCVLDVVLAEVKHLYDITGLGFGVRFLSDFDCFGRIFAGMCVVLGIGRGVS